MGTCRSRMWFPEKPKKEEEVEEDDGFGRGLLADDSESGQEDNKPKKKFDFYGGVLDLTPKGDQERVSSSENKSSDDW
jgi:hypothetical protein